MSTPSLRPISILSLKLSQRLILELTWRLVPILMSTLKLIGGDLYDDDDVVDAIPVPARERY